MRFKDILTKLRSIALSASPDLASVRWVRNVLAENVEDLAVDDRLKLEFFFWRYAQSHDWHAYLKELIKNCPQIEKTETGFRMPIWPAENFIRRLLVDGKTEIFDTLLEIKTDNPRFFRVVADASIYCDNHKRIEILPLLIVYADNRLGFSKGGLIEAAIKYAECGQIDEACRLLQHLVEFLPDEEEAKKLSLRSAGEDLWTTRLEPRPKLDHWEYAEALEKVSRALAKIAPLKTADVLIQVVVKMLEHKYFADSKEASTYADYSEIWCRRVTGSDRKHKDSKELLIFATTFACEQVFEHQPDSVDSLNNLLIDAKWHVLQRIRLHLYSQYPGRAKTWLKGVIENYTGYSNQKYGYEMQLAIKNGFLHFGQDLVELHVLQRIFQAVLDGPDKAGFRVFSGDAFTEDNFLQYQNHFWTYQLRPFQAVLFGEYKSVYDKLMTNLNRKINDEDYSRVSEPESKVFTHESPISEHELKQFDDASLIKFLNTWTSDPEIKKDWWVEVDSTGLGKALQKLIQADLPRFLSWGKKWHEINKPIYLRFVLELAADRVKVGNFEGLAVWMDIAEWIVVNASEIDSDELENHAERKKTPESDWMTNARSAVDLLGACVENPSFPAEFRERILALLKSLCFVRDGLLESDSPSFSPSDGITEAINSSQGRALDFLINYCVWQKQKLDTTEYARVLFDVLEKRFSAKPKFESPEIALLGMNFHRLHYLDSDWSERNRNKVFPKGDFSAWSASFGAYVRLNRPEAKILECLMPEYSMAVESIGKLLAEADESLDIIDCLGQHLFAFYIWNKISLDDELFVGFYRNTTPTQWASLFDHVGRSLKSSPSTLSPAIIERCHAFFEWRLAAGNSVELHEITFWIEAECFSPQWRLNALLRVLNFTSHIPEQSSFLVSTLSGLIDSCPELVMDCFTKISERALQDGHFYVDKEEAKKILRIGLSSPLTAVVNSAEQAQENLLRGGYFEYLDI